MPNFSDRSDSSSASILLYSADAPAFLHLQNQGRLFEGVPEGTFVYFVHSFYLKAKEERIVRASSDYGVAIHASVEQDSVFACQFHPEKSSSMGLKILRNFAGIGEV